MDEPAFRRKFRLNKKIAAWAGGIFLGLCFFGAMFFFSFFQIKHIEVRGSTRYSDAEIKSMVLKGLFSDNSVLAPIFCSNDNVKDVFFVDGYSVTQMSKDTIAINVREKKPVGCIPFLDSYIYFDRNGIFIDGSRTREDKIPYFSGIEVKKVVEDEKLSFRGNDILSTAVTLSTIFQKEQSLPDYVAFDGKGQITLMYGMITVNLGQNRYLEDKMARAIAILPKITGRKGILHLESVKENSKIVTFEPQEPTAEELAAIAGAAGVDPGELSVAEGTGEESEESQEPEEPYVMSEDLQYALYAWIGGYTEWGEYTGEGEYDSYGNYIGPYPTEELIASFGDWKGGYTENGMFNGRGEYDHAGNYVGPNPNAPESAEEEGSSGEESGETAGEAAGSGAETTGDGPETTGDGPEVNSQEETEETQEPEEPYVMSEELQYALYAWVGGYTEWGEFTGDGEYDSFGHYIGPYPTEELIASFGDWKGGYTENGMFNGRGEYDHAGNYVGPNPNAPESEETTEDSVLTP